VNGSALEREKEENLLQTSKLQTSTKFRAYLDKLFDSFSSEFSKTITFRVHDKNRAIPSCIVYGILQRHALLGPKVSKGTFIRLGSGRVNGFRSWALYEKQLFSASMSCCCVVAPENRDPKQIISEVDDQQRHLISW
jgi:hypothetical protein